MTTVKPALPPANNVFMDDHLVYAGLLVVLALLGAENTWAWADGGGTPSWSPTTRG
jgi:hypothetical protein